MKKSIICLGLAAVFLFGGCDKKIKLDNNDLGFYDKKNGIQYEICSMRAVRPLAVGEEYATDGENIYYTIPFQEPKEYICDRIEGVSYVYRASTMAEITINNFNPIAAFVYIEGEASLPVSTFYCAQEFLPEELRGENMQDDSELVYSIRDALIKDERVMVKDQDIDHKNDFYLRLLSADYPGLYYMVVFFTDINGEAYIRDRGTNDVVAAPVDLTLRIIG